MENNPSYKAPKFTCPHCNSIAQQKWIDSHSAGNVVFSIVNDSYLNYRTGVTSYAQEQIGLFVERTAGRLANKLEEFFPQQVSIATCEGCGDVSLWISKEMVYPKRPSLPQPNQDIDDDIKDLYQEAATIFSDSPKGATALLRLAVQKLLKQLGKSGKNINSDIGELVSEGLDPKVQKALDILRVVGNNAVHPGEINVDDNSDIALKLFHVLSFIANEMITKPKELELLYNNTIPETTQEHIKNRDGT